MGKQCTSMYPTHDGAVFCTGEQNHLDDHVGYRKRWRTCTACSGSGKTPARMRCVECKGVGNILVKKVKPVKEARDDKGG